MVHCVAAEDFANPMVVRRSLYPSLRIPAVPLPPSDAKWAKCNRFAERGGQEFAPASLLERWCPKAIVAQKGGARLAGPGCGSPFWLHLNSHKPTCALQLRRGGLGHGR